MLSGLIPSDGSDEEELQRRILAGRYGEVRMLFFLGRDVFRWMEQCMEWSIRINELQGTDMQLQSFAGLLTGSPPDGVKQKLIGWGVADYASIFCRAIGLNAMFSEPPTLEQLGPDFLHNYHQYADALYRCYMDSQRHRRIAGKNFRFELYASGEYTRLLETEWGTETE